MSRLVNFRFETYEGYYGDSEEVIEQVFTCKACGHKLLQSHLPDYEHMFIQESSNCPNCGKHRERVLHKLN